MRDGDEQPGVLEEACGAACPLGEQQTQTSSTSDRLTERWPPPRMMTQGIPELGATVKAEAKHPARVLATRCFRYGETIAREKPWLCIPRDARSFVAGAGNKAIREVGKRIGDFFRLGIFVAFGQLPEAECKEFLAMGGGAHVAARTREALGHFLDDYPEFQSALDWDLLAAVVGIALDRGNTTAQGDFVVYRHCSVAAHSFCPNAVVETRGEKNEKELRVIAFDGIAESEEITVSYLPEDQILLPAEEQLVALMEARGGQVPEKVTTSNRDITRHAEALERIRRAKHQDVLELRQLVQDLDAVDRALPFALACRARARANLARACEQSEDIELVSKALLLYSIASDEVEVVLGPEKAHTQLENLSRLSLQLQAHAS
mmetsp:Transcript_14899/g.33952  ORF Transcript_14899/g.33952 Transcript_14899/m.33952 type:complete len:377 (-) Transcript_14899:2-1132(-)